MTRRRAILMVAAMAAVPAHAEPTPLVGVLAPSASNEVFHAVPGWHPSSRHLRVLDDAGRPLCCLRVLPTPLAQPSDLSVADSKRGTRHVVSADGPLARRLVEGPLLAPVLERGVKAVRVDSEHAQLKWRGARWSLDRCTTQEGLRLTLSSASATSPLILYFPLGYDVEPTCR